MMNVNVFWGNSTNFSGHVLPFNNSYTYNLKLCCGSCTLPGKPHAPTPYAFIRWFKRARERGDPLENAGCERIVYEPPKRGSDGVYDVIHLSSIVCRHHVVPDFKSKGAFYVSAFSPCRPV